jgi:uncharacterized phage-associated protein
MFYFLFNAIIIPRHLVDRRCQNMPYSPIFEQKATEAASILLRLSGGEMSRLKLIKLLYFADRKALEEWERPITYDNFASLPKGPVVSSILNLARGKYPHSEYWDQYIEKIGINVKIRGEFPKIKKLSPADVKLLTKIFAKYGKYTGFDLADMSEKLPEWRNPGTSSYPIELPDLLKKLHYDTEEIERISSEILEKGALDSLFV